MDSRARKRLRREKEIFEIKERKRMLIKQLGIYIPDNFERYYILLSVVILFILLLVFFHQVAFQGKLFIHFNQINSNSVATFRDKALDNGIYPLWCPYIFSGMPALGSLITAPKLNFIDYYLYQFFEFLQESVSLTPWFFYILNYLLFGVFTFLMLKNRRLNLLACIFGAFSIIFIPQYIAFTAFGLNTKFLSLMLIPLIFFLVDRMLERKNILYFSLTALIIGFQLMRAQIQVSYYTFLLIGIYYIFRSIFNLKDKKGIKSVINSGILLIGASSLGFMLSSVINLPVLEYFHYSARATGLNYSDATAWSFHPFEMITFLVPSFMGFGGQTYWGWMNFTDYPLYFSVIVLLLSGVAFILKRNRFTIFLGIVAFVSLLVSFGKFFPILFDPMFKWLPFFNIFRIPSMIHILLDFAMIILAVIGLDALFEFRKMEGSYQDKKKKQMNRFFLIFSGILGIIVFGLLFNKSIYMLISAGGDHALKETFREIAYKNATLDALKSFLLVGFAIFLIRYYFRQRINNLFLTIFIITLTIIDLWWVNSKIIQPIEPLEQQEIFARTPVMEKIKKDKNIFRIFPLFEEKSGNWYMHHEVQNILGYHPAKMRIYQDFLDETGFATSTQFGFPQFLSKYFEVVSQGGQLIWQPILAESIPPNRLNFDNAMLDMLNVKYIISHVQLPIYDTRFTPIQLRDFRGGPYQFTLYENTQVLPRAFFANSVKKLKGRKPIFDYMKSGNFDPRAVAIIEDDAPFAVAPADSNTVTVTKYDIREIHLDAQVKTPAVMVLSEIYYPAGWKVFVDGRETKIYKANYLLRSIFLKPGNHQIRFVFNPSSFQLGFWISLITLIILLGLIAFTVTMEILKKRKPRPLAEEPDLIVT